jgi:hypothetical protein
MRNSNPPSDTSGNSSKFRPVISTPFPPDLDGVRQRGKGIFGRPAEGIPGISEHIEKQLALAEELAPLF